MKYKEIKPCKVLRQYVKFYFIYESDADITFEDRVFPSGCMEIIFNLGTGKWATSVGDSYVINPQVELWGQLTQPLPIKSIGKNSMLGIRFYPHATAYFLGDNLNLFNNQVMDLSEISGNGVKMVHTELLETADWDNRIALIEKFLLQKLMLTENKFNKLNLVGDVMKELKREDFLENIETIAGRYGITSRYLQKLFLQYTGLTPKLYGKINRFQNSLRLLSKNDTSLTSIAYDCGYFDQSHFIRDFKAFTGLTPSGYSLENFSINSVFVNN